MKGPWGVEPAEAWAVADDRFSAEASLPGAQEEQFQAFEAESSCSGSCRAAPHLEYEWPPSQDESLNADGGDSWMESWEPDGEMEIDFVPPKDAQPGDAREPGFPWRKPGKPKAPRTNPVYVEPLKTIESARVLELHLLDFAVDRYELHELHRKALADVARQLKDSIQKGEFSGEKILAYAYGETSSTGHDLHNLKLSRHRAYNTLKGLYDALTAEGIAERMTAGYYGTGEQRSVLKTGQGKEDPNFRGALLRLVCPLAAKECPVCADCPPPQTCPTPPACPPPGDSGGDDGGGGIPPPPRGTSSLCFAVASIARPQGKSLLPGVVPINPFLSALKLPVALVLDGRARIKVAPEGGRPKQFLDFKGWGLEVALPGGRLTANLQVDLRAAIDLIGRQAGGLMGRVVAGPLAVVAGIDVAVVGRMVASLALHLKARLELDFKSPGLPEPSGCRMIRTGLPTGTAPDLRNLTGTAFLIVPGRGFGAATLMLKGSNVQRLRLERDNFQLPADKSNVRTLLALGGQLKLAQAGSREAEFEAEALPADWPESLLEVGGGNF